MKIVTTTVGRKGPDDRTHNQERFAVATRALEKATNLDGDLLALPAGFFTASHTQERESIAQSLIGTAKQVGIAVVFGVDQVMNNLDTDLSWQIQGGGLPSYGYAWSPSENLTHCWAQRSTNSTNQRLVPNEKCQERRLLKIGDESIALLLCGEIFNQRIRQALRDYQPKVVVDIAHVGSGFRVFQGMKVLAKSVGGLPSVCSVHVQSENAMKYCYIPPGNCRSSRMTDGYVYGPPKIELKSWTF